MTKSRPLQKDKKPTGAERRDDRKRDAPGSIARVATSSPRVGARNALVVPITHATTWSEVKVLLGPTTVPASAIRRAAKKAALRGQILVERHKVMRKSPIRTREKATSKAR